MYALTAIATASIRLTYAQAKPNPSMKGSGPEVSPLAEKGQFALMTQHLAYCSHSRADPILRNRQPTRTGLDGFEREI